MNDAIRHGHSVFLNRSTSSYYFGILKNLNIFKNLLFVQFSFTGGEHESKVLKLQDDEYFDWGNLFDEESTTKENFDIQNEETEPFQDAEMTETQNDQNNENTTETELEVEKDPLDSETEKSLQKEEEPENDDSQDNKTKIVTAIVLSTAATGLVAAGAVVSSSDDENKTIKTYQNQRATNKVKKIAEKDARKRNDQQNQDRASLILGQAINQNQSQNQTGKPQHFSGKPQIHTNFERGGTIIKPTKGNAQQNESIGFSNFQGDYMNENNRPYYLPSGNEKSVTFKDQDVRDSNADESISSSQSAKHRKSKQIVDRLKSTVFTIAEQQDNSNSNLSVASFEPTNNTVDGFV